MSAVGGRSGFGRLGHGKKCKRDSIGIRKFIRSIGPKCNTPFEGGFRTALLQEGRSEGERFAVLGYLDAIQKTAGGEAFAHLEARDLGV